MPSCFAWRYQPKDCALMVEHDKTIPYPRWFLIRICIFNMKNKNVLHLHSGVCNTIQVTKINKNHVALKHVDRKMMKKHVCQKNQWARVWPSIIVQLKLKRGIDWSEWNLLQWIILWVLYKSGFKKNRFLTTRTYVLIKNNRLVPPVGRGYEIR